MSGKIEDWIGESLDRVEELIQEESPSREDYFRWCGSDGIEDLSAIEGGGFDVKCRNAIVERWINAAKRVGVDGGKFKEEVEDKWDVRTAKEKVNGDTKRKK